MGIRKKMTQEDRVLRHLQDRGSITSWEAIQQYGITRIHAKIFNLKAKGYEIKDEWCYARNRYKEPVRFKKYKLDTSEGLSFWEKLMRKG